MFWRLRARQTGVVVYTNAQKPLREVWAAYPEPDVLRRYRPAFAGLFQKEIESWSASWS